MKKLPIGIQSFEKLRTDNFIYVDKTEYIYELTKENGYYFISRPRRFGKSLLVDTIKCLFEGKKELFEGLFIYDKWNWEEKYPVIR
ncbi:MAG: AAA family ATPase, partial [Bacteroidia bacterium]|nr:AAA family ATPase [Bacteroidia bacterium]